MGKRAFITVSFAALFLCGMESQSAVYNSAIHQRVTDNGAIGDGIADDTLAINNTITTANAAGKYTYFPAGDYRYSPAADGSFNGASIVGADKSTTTITGDNVARYIYPFQAQDITIDNVAGIGGSTTPGLRHFKNMTLTTTYGGYVFYDGYPELRHDYLLEDLTVDAQDAYGAIWLYKPGNVTAINLTVINGTGFPLRFETPYPGARLRVSGGSITGGTTGVFFGANRTAPIEAIVVEDVSFTGQSEETISFDGFGNNADLIPEICLGPISSVSNDNNNRLVVGMDNMVYSGGSCPVSTRNDWTNFYFTLGTGTGQDGSFAKIYSYDNVANTLTLSTDIPADNVTVGGEGGVQSGFFFPVVRRCKIFGSHAVNSTAISLWLNVFGADIDGNFISGVTKAITVAGGTMLSPYHPKAWHNIVQNNTILISNQRRMVGGQGGIPQYDDAAVQFSSLYVSSDLQYGNGFINNTMVGGGIYIKNQVGFRWGGNSLRGVAVGILWP